MRSFSVRVIHNNLPSMGAKLRRLARQAALDAAEEAAQIARQEMQGPKSGATYGDHQASAPGEAPAIDTGRLFASVDVRQSGAEVYLVEDGYGLYLEQGTDDIEPRPHLEPAAEQVRPRFLSRMADAVERAAR
jgi:hypothetical protein